MYLDHFGLTESPFRLTPDPALLYWTDGHHRAFDALTLAAHADRPVTTILGEPGTGKTTLLQHFLADLPKDMRVGMISNYSSGLGGLDRWLHWAFDLPAARPEGDLWAAFRAFLVDQRHKRVRCLLIVDEAQNVSREDIAALIGLTRLPALPDVSMRLVLTGQPPLRRRLPRPTDRDEAADSAPVQIGAMSPEEVDSYIRHRMAMAGCSDAVFDGDVIRRVAWLSGGVPRLVNLLCELLLISAYKTGESEIDSAFMDDVLQDVRQTGMLDHLLIPPERLASGMGRPGQVRAPAPRRARASKVAGLAAPSVLDPEPTEPGASSEIAARPASAEILALPDPPRDDAATPVEAIRPRNRRADLSGIAAGIAAAAVTFAVLQHDWIAGAQATFTNASAPVQVGPALPAPATIRGSDAATLHDQALIVGAEDPRAAVIGFARAALRGDTRAAFYVGQHFEVGDGVPRNAALAAAWYGAASKTERSARRALESLTGTSEVTGEAPSAPPRPLMGITGADGSGEYVWTAPDGAAARYLIELAETPDAPPQQHGPFDLSAALLASAAPARLWRVVSLDPDGVRVSASDWHLVETEKIALTGPAP